MPATAQERLAAARAAVDQACQLLLAPTPEQMDRCTGLLETAVAELTAFRQVCPVSAQRPLPAENLSLARSLAASVARLKRLLESAGAFHANWIRCLAAICAGYTEQGQPATLERGGHLLARG